MIFTRPSRREQTASVQAALIILFAVQLTTSPATSATSMRRLCVTGRGSLLVLTNEDVAESYGVRLAENATRLNAITAQTVAQEWTVLNEHSVFDIATVYAVV